MTRTGTASALFITACNPWSKELDVAQNLSAQAALRIELETLTEHILPGHGEEPTETWRAEPSWLALGISPEEACRLGTPYRQNALIWSDVDATPRLVFLR